MDTTTSVRRGAKAAAAAALTAATVPILALAVAAPAGAAQPGLQGQASPTGVLAAGQGPEAHQTGQIPGEPSGAFVFDDGHFTPLAAIPGAAVSGHIAIMGRYTTIEAPGAAVETGAGGINNRGVIVGSARGGGMPNRGYLRDAGGTFTSIRFPGARSTLAQKINDRNQVTGYYSLTADDPRADIEAAFLLDRGHFTRIAFPGATATTAVGINNRTQLVGQYQDTDGNYHGYLWEQGQFQTIDAPGAAATSLVDINDRGQILGLRQ